MIVKKYLIKWTERSYHEVTVDGDEMANLLCLAELTPQVHAALIDGSHPSISSLADDLSEYSQDGFQYLYRTNIEIENAA